MALVDDEVTQSQNRMRFISLEIHAGSKSPSKAILEMSIDGQAVSAAATGNGPVDAGFNAIKELVPHQANLQLYQVSAVTQGTDAQAEVTVRLEENGRTVIGQGADADTIVASVRAYIHALNKLTSKRLKTAPPESASANAG